MERKYYVVWKGNKPGIYVSWNECRQQVAGFKGAAYKSFKTSEEAEAAFRSSPTLYITKKTSSPTRASVRLLPPEVAPDSIAVDAACAGVPGDMEYRGVDLRTFRPIFHFGPLYGTNNIGEFLAIVHALALLDKQGTQKTIWSDSRTALLWVKNKRCNTKLPRTEKTEQLFLLIRRAEEWLNTHTLRSPLRKWDTKHWGEIPADFGRK